MPSSCPTLLLTTCSLLRADIAPAPVAPASWQAVALLLEACDSTAPSLHGMHVAIALTQQLAGGATTPRVLMLTCGSLAANAEPSDAAHGGAWGFARVLRLEHAALRTQSVDGCSHGVTMLAHRALAAPTPEVEVSWRATECFASRLRVCLTSPATRNALARGEFMITGGLGGLGLRAAKMVAESGAVGVVLSSRSGRVGGLAVEAKHTLEMRVAVCDGGDAADALALLARALPMGVLHAAGVLHDT